MESSERPTMGVNEALGIMQGIYHEEILPMGGNDSEHEYVRRKLAEVQAGTITPEAGVAAIRELRESKQDYH